MFIKLRSKGKPVTSIRRIILGVLSLLAGCASDTYVVVDSTNQNSRIDYIVVHATSENFGESLRLLSTPTSNPVSSHYLVPELNDDTYPEYSLRIHLLVPEFRRAWHAGVSYWAEEESLNDRSIGIEIVNEFKCTGTEIPVPDIKLEDVECHFPSFSDEQIELVTELLSSILERYPGIDPIDVVAHSDIAIMRKSDPGPLFPWKQLHEQGIGAWPDDTLLANYRRQFTNELPDASALQSALLILGYKVEVTGQFDKQTQFAVRAFQLHYRPSDYSGDVDVETAARLWALIEEYRPRKFAVL